MQTKKILRNTVSLSPSWLQKFFFKESLDVTFFKCFVMFALFGTDVSLWILFVIAYFRSSVHKSCFVQVIKPIFQKSFHNNFN